MKKERNTVIVQRFYYSFREGFYDYLFDINYKFRLINSTTPRGKVRIHDNVNEHTFIEKTFCLYAGDKHVFFPFLFFKLIKLNPAWVVTEGGANTINNFAIYLYCLVFRRKYVIWDLGKGFSDFGNSAGRRIYMSFYRFLLRHSAFVYGYNTLSREYFLSLGIGDEKIIVLNNTIDTRKIMAVRKENSATMPPELEVLAGSGFTFLIFVGALVKSKNIEALSGLMNSLGSNYFLIIVGDGNPEYVAGLKTRFEGTNHAFVGYKKNDELLPYYSLSSFSVLPGLGGLSINQSMAFGVPVICHSADGAEKDLVINNETGYIFNETEDAVSFIRSKTDDDWKRMGKNAEELIYSKHSVESMMDKFISYLK